MKKKLLIALGVLVVLAVVAGVVVFSNLDRIVRSATERVMAYVLQVDVSVGGAHVNIGQGSIEFSDIVIPNPPGYDTDRAMKFGLVKAQVDIASFRGDQPVIKLIQVSQAEITMEARKGGSNLQDLMNNASRLASGEEKPKEEEPKEAGKKFKIETVLVDGTTVRVGVPFMGGKTFEVKLPDLEMHDIGGEKEGATPAEAMQEILAGILGGIKKAGADILPTEVLTDLTGALKNLPGEIKTQVEDIGKQLESGLKDTGSQVEKAADSVGQEIKGLFGKKKEEEKK